MAVPLPISEIVRQAAVELGLEVAAGAVVSSTNIQIQRLLQAALQTGRDLRQNYYYPQLKKLFTFTTTTGIQYPFPADFWKMIPGAQWDVSNQWKMQGPLTDQMWYLFQFGTISSFVRTRYYISGADTFQGQFFVNPAPTSGNEFAFPYIRSQFFFPQLWTEGDTIGATPAYRSSAGNIYVSASAGTTGSTFPDWTTGTDSDGGVDWTYVPSQLYGTNQKFAEDTDYCLIDDDLFILGIKRFYLAAKGMDASQETAQYEAQAKSRDMRTQGSQILRLGATDAWPFIGYNNIPEGSW